MLRYFQNGKAVRSVKCHLFFFPHQIYLFFSSYQIYIIKLNRSTSEFVFLTQFKQFKCHAIFTARKRSLGQGNIFRSVCQEFCRGGIWSRGVSGPRRCLVGGGLPGPGGCLVWGVPGPRGEGCLVPGGCLVLGGVETPPGRLLLRAVRILLEFILVAK